MTGGVAVNAVERDALFEGCSEWVVSFGATSKPRQSITVRSLLCWTVRTLPELLIVACPGSPLRLVGWHKRPSRRTESRTQPGGQARVL